MRVLSYLRRLSTLVAATAALASVGAAPATAEPLKIGFIYVSPIGDAGWTYQHDLGRKEMEAALEGRVETTFVESVPEGADAERVIRQLASSGNKLIFTTSFGYMNPTVKVAKQFPDLVFEHATGYKTADNLATYLARFYEGRYLTGLVAGRMTESNVVGYVAAFPIPEVIRGINAFTRGLREVNAEAEVRVIWVSAWYDPGKEREAAEALIGQGADVITQHTDSTAPVQAAEERGVHAIGYHSDMSKYGPKAHLTAATHLWGKYYTQVAQNVLDGTWKSHSIWGGVKEGMIALAPFGEAVPEDVRQMVLDREKQIASGEFHPFQGPVKNQKGEVRIPEGQTMSDDELLAMDWYVEGVVGELPK